MRIVQQIFGISLMVSIASLDGFNFKTLQQEIMYRCCPLFSYMYPHQAHDACLQQYAKYKDESPAKFNYYMRRALIKYAESMPQEAKGDTILMAIMYDANMIKYVNHVTKLEACAKAINDPLSMPFYEKAIERLCAESKALQDKKEAYTHRDWLPAI